ncbi:hypothetical protein V2G26_019366 [Clonostachys chloroleuca]
MPDPTSQYNEYNLQHILADVESCIILLTTRFTFVIKHFITLSKQRPEGTSQTIIYHQGSRSNTSSHLRENNLGALGKKRFYFQDQSFVTPPQNHFKRHSQTTRSVADSRPHTNGFERPRVVALARLAHALTGQKLVSKEFESPIQEFLAPTDARMTHLLSPPRISRRRVPPRTVITLGGEDRKNRRWIDD